MYFRKQPLNGRKRRRAGHIFTRFLRLKASAAYFPRPPKEYAAYFLRLPKEYSAYFLRPPKEYSAYFLRPPKMSVPAPAAITRL